MYKNILIVCLFFLCQKGDLLFAQIDTVSLKEGELIQEDNFILQLENLAESAEDEQDYSEILEDYTYYNENKININQPDYDILMAVFKLTDYQIYHLKRYLDINQVMYSIYELASIEGFTMETVRLLLPYVVLLPIDQSRKTTLKNVFKYGKNTCIMRYTQVLNKQSAYRILPDSLLELKPNAIYRGSRPYLLFKYKFDYASKIRFGITAEKDAGEEFFKGSNKQGFDFYSFHFFMKDVKFIKSLAVGDYQIKFGQGVAIWTGFQSPTIINPMEIYRYAQSITPYTSSNENNYLRGVASELQFGKFRFALFYSYRKKDAYLEKVNHSDNQYIYSLQEMGYHRTLTEIERKNNIKQQLLGTFATYTHRVLRVGVGVFYSHYNYPFYIDEKPYNLYKMNQQDVLNASVNYNVIIKKVSVFGENALSNNGGFALLNGLIYYVDPLLNFTLLYRYYSKDYQAVQANAYRQATVVNNEDGLLLGLQMFLNKYVTLNAHVDFYRFMWLKYTTDAPSIAYKVLTRWHFDINRKFTFYFQFKHADKNVNESMEYYNQLIAVKKQNYRLNAIYKPLYNLQLKSCLEYVVLQQKNNKEKLRGYLIYQDIVWKYKWVTLTGRYALFHTDSYDTRLYAYENDVLYASSIPAYYGIGNRIYVMMKMEVSSYVNIWVRVAQSFYKNKQTIGTGLEEIDGNSKSDIHLQIIVKV